MDTRHLRMSELADGHHLTPFKHPTRLTVTVMSVRLYQVGRLEAQTARLQSKQERGEAERQRLEYCLAVAQREVRQREEAIAARETEFQALQEQLQGTVLLLIIR